MYQDTPYANYFQVREALSKQKVTIRIAKNQYKKLFKCYGQDNWFIAASFLAQFIFPITFIVCWSVYTGEKSVLPAVILYIAFPFFFSSNSFISTALTAIGLFGFVEQWPAVITACFIPGVLSYFGTWLLQQSIILTVVRKIMLEQSVFEELWQNRLIALEDRRGVYQYTAGKSL